MTGPVVDQLAAQLAIPLWATTYFESPQVAVYGQVGSLAGVVEVIHATRPLTAHDRADGLAYVKDHPATGMSAWSAADAGKLGGEMVCGTATRGSISLTLCTMVDPAGLVVTATDGSGDASVAMARRLREAVEHRG
jgi:hypothetical protein